jgi:tripartite-type tricarboxylate transporter receptor subunit TctC
VPAGTPPDAVAKLSTGLAAALADSTLQADFRSRGIAPLTMDAPAFTAYVRDEDRSWRDVITQAGIQVQ